MALAFLAYASDGLPIAPAHEPKEKVVPMQEVDDTLEKLLSLQADSYQALLREASHLVPPVLRGQEWADVQNLMHEHAFTVVEAWENGDAVHSYHLLKSKAVWFPNGYSLDLYLLLSAPNLNRPRTPSRTGRLYAANVALVADINAPYSLVIGQKRYPEGSVLDVILSSEQVREAGAVWPLLKKLYVNYEPYVGLGDEVEVGSDGFLVSGEFTASAKEKIGGKKMYFYVASGLGYRSQDPFPGIREGGSSEWWDGDEETVERNKQKYLKYKQ